LSYNTLYVWIIASVAALGGLLFGYDWVVIGGAKPFYEKYFQLRNPSAQGWAMSCALIGCLMGAVLAGGLSDKFGRKLIKRGLKDAFLAWLPSWLSPSAKAGFHFVVHDV